MKKLVYLHHKPTDLHMAIAHERGDDTLGTRPPDEFLSGCPRVDGWEIAEPGCLLRVVGCVYPHTDAWLNDVRGGPRPQRSLFWLIGRRGTCAVWIKVDGFAAVRMLPGDAVLFDHRREHMVLSDGEWTGAAWQLRRRTPKDVRLSGGPTIC